MGAGGDVKFAVGAEGDPVEGVKAVGQVELVLSLLASVLFFGEKISARELVGMAILSGSILMLVLVA